MTAQASAIGETTAASAASIRGRWAVTAIFFLNGLTLSTYLVRLPSIKAEHHLSDGQLGLVGTVFGAAALVTMQFVGASVARFGSARIIRFALLLLPIALIGVGFSHGLIAFAVAVMLLGAIHGTVDVAMNAHAVAVERLRERPIMNGCHAAWSVSAVVASLLGAALTRAGITPAAHFVWIGVLVIAGALAVGPFLMAASVDQTPTARIEPHVDGPQRSRAPSGWRTGWTRSVLMIGATGTALMVCDGAALGWAGIFLHDSRGATLAVAALAVTAYTACQTVGRLAGDRLKMRYGAAALFRTGALIGTAGFALAVVSDRPWIVIVGFAIFGLGASVLIPLTFSAVGHAGGSGAGAATMLSRFTTFTYSGILLGPALIGWVADGVGLTWTLAALVPVLAGVAWIRLPAPTTET